MKPRRKITAAILLGLCASFGVGFFPAAAQDIGSIDDGVPAAAQDIGSIDDGVFKSADLNNDGKISRREILHSSDLAFLSVDTNNDDILTVEEFLEWDPGYLFLAEKTGKTAQLNAAKQEVFKLLDINGDGSLEHDEFSAASLYDFYRADVNSDGALSQDEFIGEYRVLKTVRSALE